MLTLTFLIKTIIDLYIMVLLLRIWMQWAHCDLYHPFSQFIIKIIHPVIGPIQQIIPAMGLMDSASLFLAFILAVIKLPLLTFIEIHTLNLDPIYLLIGILALLKTAGELIFWVIITRSLINWASQGNRPMDIVLYQLSELLMLPIRRILPVTSGIDFSPMIILITLYALNYLGMDLFPGIWYRL